MTEYQTFHARRDVGRSRQVASRRIVGVRRRVTTLECEVSTTCVIGRRPPRAGLMQIWWLWTGSWMTSASITSVRDLQELASEKYWYVDESKRDHSTQPPV